MQIGARSKYHGNVLRFDSSIVSGDTQYWTSVTPTLEATAEALRGASTGQVVDDDELSASVRYNCIVHPQHPRYCPIGCVHGKNNGGANRSRVVFNTHVPRRFTMGDCNFSGHWQVTHFHYTSPGGCCIHVCHHPWESGL